MPASSKTKESLDHHTALVKTYFDDNAKEWSSCYDQAQRINDVVLTDRKQYAVSCINKCRQPGARILDAGCGAGLAALDLVRRGYHVHGVDISRKMIELARQNFAEQNIPIENYSFECTELDQSLGKDIFDGVLALGFLQYQPDEDHALQRIRDLLRPDGVLVLSGPMKRKLSDGFGLLSGAQRAAQRLLGSNRTALSESVKMLRHISPHSYSVGRFRTLLHRNGFRMIEFKGHGFVHFPMLSHRLGFRGELALHRSLSRLAQVSPIGRWANDLVVMARKI